MGKKTNGQIKLTQEKAALSRSDIEARILVLKTNFEQEAKQLDEFVKTHNAAVEMKRAELARMQTEYVVMNDLLTKYSW